MSPSSDTLPAAPVGNVLLGWIRAAAINQKLAMRAEIDFYVEEAENFQTHSGLAHQVHGTPNIHGVGLDANPSGVNIIGCLYEWFTDTRFGRGYPDSKLNQGAWEVTATALAALRVSPLITDEDDFKLTSQRRWNISTDG